jgi:BON domain-containing protein
VTLSGTVATPAQKSKAAQGAKGVEGVKGVKNNLVVSANRWVSAKLKMVGPRNVPVDEVGQALRGY